jgi:acyl-CoA thioesterase
MILRALCETVGQAERSPRSLTIHYARAPRPGAVALSVVHERKGRSLSTLSVRMEQEGRLIALALAAFSVPWSAPEIAEAQMPEVARPDGTRETLAALRELVEHGRAPQFLHQMVVQPRIGAVPFSASEEPMRVGAWLGLRDATRPCDQLALALFSDALYLLAPLPACRRPRDQPHGRPHDPLPLRGSRHARRRRGAAVLRAVPLAARARRLLRGGRPHMGARRHAARALAPARDPDGAVIR